MTVLGTPLGSEIDTHLDDLRGTLNRCATSVRLIPGCWKATCSAKLLPTISTATAMIRDIFIWTSFRLPYTGQILETAKLYPS